MSAGEDGVDRLRDLRVQSARASQQCLSAIGLSFSRGRGAQKEEKGEMLTASNAGCGIPVLLTGPTVLPGANCGLLPLTRSNKLLPLLGLLLPLGPPPAGPSYLALCCCLSAPLPPSS